MCQVWKIIDIDTLNSMIRVDLRKSKFVYICWKNKRVDLRVSPAFSVSKRGESELGREIFCGSIGHLGPATGLSGERGGRRRREAVFSFSSSSCFFVASSATIMH